MPELHIYTTSGSHVTTLHSFDSEPCTDAVWTRGGNIVCTNKIYLMVLSMTGKVLNKFDQTLLEYLSVSQFGDIYVSDTRDVYESTDDGMTWSVKFSIYDSNSYAQQAIRVSSDQYNDFFWTAESEPDSENKQLYVYTLNKTADSAIWGTIRSSVTMSAQTKYKHWLNL
jgi:hypothetical protein